jgi:RNA polymerase sigma factor (sigma-70 family)
MAGLFCFLPKEIPMTPNNDLFVECLDRVEHKIRAYARFFAFIAPHVEEDDLFQEAMLKLLERYHAEPEFLSHNDSYISCYAAWMMKNYLNRERNMYVKRVADLENDKGEVLYTYPSSHFPRPESEAVRSEVHTIAEQMPEQYQVIYKATLQGYDEQEVADMLGISKCALHWRKHTMMETLKKAWRTPVGEREYIIHCMYEWPSVYDTSSENV